MKMTAKARYERLSDNVLRLETRGKRYDQIEVGRALNQLAQARFGLLRYRDLPGVEAFIDDLSALETTLEALPVEPLIPLE